jgi:hypothetical protein
MRLDFETGQEFSMSKYLGIWFHEQGVDWDRSVKQTSLKVRETTNLLRSYGFNGYGWTPSTTITSYKAFSRTTMEYGLALQPMLDENLQLLERTIKSELSVHARTSCLATLTICGLATMKDRNLALNSLFITRYITPQIPPSQRSNYTGHQERRKQCYKVNQKRITT